MEERKQRCSMQLKLEIVRATNIALHDQHGCKLGSLFVRCHLSKKIAVNSKEVEASPEPHWGETLSLECEGKGVDEMLSKSVVIFEVRWRRRRRGMFGGLKSKLLGRVEVSWEELLSYQGLSINKWFPLVEKTSLAPTRDHHALPLPATSALQIAVSITWIEPIKMMFSHSKRRRNVEKRGRRLEREECGCGGHACRAHDQEVHFWGQV